MDDDTALVEEGEIHDDDNDPNKDDIPDNFFDDFNNEGFMESLQIVDSLDDTNAAEDSEDDKQEEEVIIAEDKVVDKSSKTKKSSRNKGRRRSRSRDKRSRRESPSRKRKFDDTAIRRDPDKTRKALEKDRENFFKKKEQKTISKIVETGLVPPGMESEVNLSAIESSDKKKEVEKAEKEKTSSNKERSREFKTSREKRSPISKERRSSVSRERRRSVSRERRRRRSRSRSFGRYRSRSIGKRRDRSAEFRKSFDRRLRSRSRSRGRNFDHDKYSSPNQNRRRRSRSRSTSDRERWLRDRDPSPERKYQGLLKEKKMSFLEEIKIKLNGNLGSPGGDNVLYSNPKNPVQPKFPQDVFSDMGLPLPMGSVQQPPPQYGQNYLINKPPVVAPMNAKYNEEFFIGNQNVAPVANVPPPMISMEHKSVVPIVGNVNNAYNASSAVPVPTPTDTSEISAKVSELIARISASTKSNSTQSGKNPQKDKPMSLTDFLHVNPAPDFSSQSEALKKKIDVLSRCQDFLKELSGDKKNNGKLRVTCTSQPKNKPEQNISPLLRQKPLKFSFNTPLSENSYQEILNRALMKTGIVSEVINLVDEDKDDSPSLATVSKRKLPSDLNSEQSRNMSKMCQTDPIKCYDCEIRKSVQYRSIGIQCGETERYNVGVQVVEEDILNSKLGKNQSLAHMTPAQLLGRGDPVSTRADNFAGLSTDRMLQPPYRGEPTHWNYPRDYYTDPVRDYYGIPRDPMREPRFPRY